VIPAQVRIFVCTEPVDMRIGFDRLAQAVRDKLGEDPQSGSLFVFTNRAATRLKVLWFERNGLCMLYKRLHRAVFVLPRGDGDAIKVSVDAQKLAQLLEGAPRTSRRTTIRSAA
jgi:transposase